MVLCESPGLGDVCEVWFARCARLFCASGLEKFGLVGHDRRLFAA